MPKSRIKAKLDVLASIPDATRVSPPGFIEPSHPTQRATAPKGDQWIHEIKIDGYRCQLRLRAGKAIAYTRRGYDWSRVFRSIVIAAEQLPVNSAIIDGEVIVPGEEGTADFGALQDAIASAQSDSMVFYAFDLLYLDGFDLRTSPLFARKQALRKLLDRTGGRFLYSEHVEGDGPTVHRRACEMGVEGIVSKLRDSPYRSGRTETWQKTLCRKRDTFVVVAFAPAATMPDAIGALYLGRETDGGLVYAGKAGTGFTNETARALRKRLDPLVVTKSPLSKPVRKPKAKWVKPELLIYVEYRAVTSEGLLRHASFKGVREELMSKGKR